MSASSGIRLDSKSAATVIASVSASPIVMLPPMLTFPVTSKFPESVVSPVTVNSPPTFVLPVTFVFAVTITSADPAGVIFNPQVTVEIVLPDKRSFPVCTLKGSTIVVFTPFIKLIPVNVVTSNVPPWNVVLPVC